MLTVEQRQYVDKVRSEQWEKELLLRRHEMITKAMEWRHQRKLNDPLNSSYAMACHELDLAVDKYVDVLRAY